MSSPVSIPMNLVLFDSDGQRTYEGPFSEEAANQVECHGSLAVQLPDGSWLSIMSNEDMIVLHRHVICTWESED